MVRIYKLLRLATPTIALLQLIREDDTSNLSKLKITSILESCKFYYKSIYFLLLLNDEDNYTVVF